MARQTGRQSMALIATRCWDMDLCFCELFYRLDDMDYSNSIFATLVKPLTEHLKETFYLQFSCSLVSPTRLKINNLKSELQPV